MIHQIILCASALLLATTLGHAAKGADFQKDDLLVSHDGRTKRQTGSQLLCYLLQNRNAGDKVAVTVLRGGSRVNLVLPMQ